MNILVLGEFDPCCVSARWKRFLASDIRVSIAVRRAYWDEGRTSADVLAETDPDPWLVRRLAADADLLVVLPAIGPNSQSAGPPRLESLDDLCPGWQAMGVPKLALFHGSRLLSHDPAGWARIYREAGCAIAATTTDYALSMGATYLPSLVDVGSRQAQLLEDLPPTLCTSTTDEKLSQEQLAIQVFLSCGVRIERIRNRGHSECLDIKARCHGGYDHLRGTFSINSLENMALGLVNVVRLTGEGRRFLLDDMDVRFPVPELGSMSEAATYVRLLAGDARSWSSTQWANRKWFEDNWSLSRIAGVLAERLRRILTT